MALPASVTGLTRPQRRAYWQRTTPTSRSRLLQRIRASQPTITPNDVFNPKVDITRRALERGYGDTLDDFGIIRQRGATDFTLGGQDLQRQRSEGVADIGLTRQRGSEDYSRSIENLNRQYGQLGQRQFEQAGVQGVRQGGTLRAAAKRRAENQGVDRDPIDTGHARFGQDLDLRTSRLNEGTDRALGELSRNYERDFGAQGDQTRLERGVRREFPIAQYDLDLQATSAAVDSGYMPPKPPAVGSPFKPKKRRARSLVRR